MRPHRSDGRPPSGRGHRGSLAQTTEPRGSAVTQTERRKDAPPAQTNESADAIRTGREAWEAGAYAASRQSVPERKDEFTTLSGEPVAPIYTPDDVAGHDFLEDVGFPGEFPYTRGPYPTMYRA